MKEKITGFLDVWKADYNFKTYSSSALSALVGLGFTIYNGFLGIYFSSIWNGTICVYYVLLAIVRGIIVYDQSREDKRKGQSEKDHQRKIFMVTHIIMFVMNVSLIVPMAVMIQGGRSYHLGMIPAITMATYTTYRIVIAIMHFSKSRKGDNVLVKELRTANLIDTLVAVMTLQNTMIMASAGEITGSMRILSMISNAVFWLMIVALSILSFCYSMRSLNDSEEKVD